MPIKVGRWWGKKETPKCCDFFYSTSQTDQLVSSVTQSYPTLCDTMNCSMPGLPVHHQLPEFTQTHVHCLENPTDRGAWKAAAHGVAKSQTRLSDFTFTFHFHALEKAMATHSSGLAWRIPGMEEPGGLPSMGCT